MVEKDDFDIEDEAENDNNENETSEYHCQDASKKALQQRRLAVRRKLESLREKQRLRNLFGDDDFSELDDD